MDLIPLFLENEEDFLVYQSLKVKKKNYNILLTKSKIKFNFEQYTNEFCLVHFRFAKDEIVRLKRALQIPTMISCPKRVKVTGMEALCILLKRLTYPNRYSDMMKFFPRTRCELSRIFNSTINFLWRKHRQLLTTLNHPWLDFDVLQVFADCMVAKGSPYSACIGFLDGTVRPICRPKNNQREYYNGHKRVHALKFQSLMFPNGIIGHLYGPATGRRHDAHLLDASGFLGQLEAKCGWRRFYVYGDPAYPLRRNVITPFKGHELTAERRICNKRMSSIREAVEWGFGKVLQQFAFLDFKKNLKIGMQNVGRYYSVGAILTNCHTCLYGSQTSAYFSCSAPVLEEYLKCP